MHLLYLHQKRINFIEKCKFILGILDGVWGLLLIQTFLNIETPPLDVRSYQIEIETLLFYFDPPPIGAISDIFEIENISMAVDPLGQTFKLTYLHQKRINFIDKGKNNSRSPWADLKRHICIGKYQKCLFILGILDGVWGRLLIQTFLKNWDPPLNFRISQIEIWTYLRKNLPSLFFCFFYDGSP